MLTDERLDGIRERSEAATSGPWGICPCTADGFTIESPENCNICVLSHRPPFTEREELERDATFISHSRADVPALLDEIDRLRAEVREYHRMLVNHLVGVMPRPGADGVFNSAWNKPCAGIMHKLISAGLMVQIGTGPNNAIFGKLTAEGRRIMENSK